MLVVSPSGLHRKGELRPHLLRERLSDRGGHARVGQDGAGERTGRGVDLLDQVRVREKRVQLLARVQLLHRWKGVQARVTSNETLELLLRKRAEPACCCSDSYWKYKQQDGRQHARNRSVTQCQYKQFALSNMNVQGSRVSRIWPAHRHVRHEALVRNDHVVELRATTRRKHSTLSGQLFSQRPAPSSRLSVCMPRRTAGVAPSRARGKRATRPAAR